MLNLVDLLSSGKTGLYFSNLPLPGEIGCRTFTPFELTLFSPLTTEHVIDLYSQFSKSQPYQEPQNKYSHLVPQWRFLDLNGNYIENIKTTDTIVTYNNTVLGTTGTASFYYVDDIASSPNLPCILWATLQTSGIPILSDNERQVLPGYTNSKVITYALHYINDTAPSHLHITRNGKTGLHPLKWQDTDFSYIITVHGNQDFSCDTSMVCGEGIIFNYPQSNSINYNINRVINSISGDNYTDIEASYQSWNPATQSFQRTDDIGNFIGGFVKGSVRSLTSISQATLSATTQIYYETTPAQVIMGCISNPKHHTLNRILYYNNVDSSIVNVITSVPLSYAELSAVQYYYDTPYITQIDPTNTWSFSGYNGIYGIAINGCYNIWTTDNESDKIYVFSTNGEVLSSFDFANGSITSDLTAGCSPAGIKLDSNNNVWVSLFDSLCVVKLDNWGTYLFSISKPAVLDVVGNYAMQPAPIETDADDNIWVGYSNCLSSMLVKYNTSGNYITQCNIETSATPFDIICDSTDNSIWVTEPYSSVGLEGKIQKFASTGGNYISSFNFVHPAYVTLDNNQTVWFTYGYHNIGYITTTGLTGGFVLSANSVTPAIPDWFDINTSIDDTALEGIACDTLNRIWVINSVDNMVYVLSATITNFDQQNFTSFTIAPCTHTSWFMNSAEQQLTYIDPYGKSAQAYGDWLGTSWRRKYISQSTTNIVSGNIEGISDVINIKAFEEPNVIRKFNTSWDATSQMRSYALPEHINSKYNLFVNYLGNMIGGLEQNIQSLGRKSYDKISNFVDNHSDIDNCNIPQLYSLAKQADVPADNYQFNYPPELQELMDIASVSHQKLWGARCQCNKHLGTKFKCENCNHEHTLNRGSTFDYLNYTLTAGEPFVVKYHYSNIYKLIEPTISGPLSSQPSVSWLLSTEYIKYDYYNYIDTFCGVQVDGIINWDDSYTTLMETNSSLSGWYTDIGILEEKFDYLLHKGLNLNKG